MSGENETAAKVDNKGRVTLPREVRESIGIEAGDTVFIKYEADKKMIYMAPAVSPFDVLAENAVEEHKKGHTIPIEKYCKKNNIPLDE